ncbi:FAD-linked oxidoreductase [Aspergillus steynii IBT 23096]|uniref:Proline dehydrogenase n=1 Tax=Aspergillus steynii IBT 23096 TaxID=1392250 RepID=A0A2I2G428_9EURO|nr:FAD-linked oxidoreductase [Aspergillus steynii IBT 23096]PLB47634.1 FAD-linked oxidoreductase [Aspergillus steynii IBT 23096]
MAARQQSIRLTSTSAPKAIALWRTAASRWKSLPKTERKVAFLAGGTSTAIIGLLLVNGSSDKEPADAHDVQTLSRIPLGKLITGWTAFAFCSSPTWVDMSENLYNILSRIPIVSSITHLFVMNVFFNQFLGGETTEDAIPKIKALRREHIGTLLGYNIEAELDGTSKDPELIRVQVGHVLESIKAQGQLGRKFYPDTSATSGDNRSWVRIKVTGLLPHPVALLHGSDAILESREARGLDRDVPYPGLPHDGDWEAALNGKQVTSSDRQQLQDLYGILDTIMKLGREENVRVIIDAEQTWYQPIIDSLTDALMQKYNALDGPAPCVASFQAYLRRYPQLLDQQIVRAQEKGYKLLFKQVRGAYIKTEGERWAKEGRQGPGPVWGTKAETDASFNYGIEKTLATVHKDIQGTGHSKIGAIFATHNSQSIDLGIKLLETYGLANRRRDDEKLVVSNEAAGSIAFGQLYGRLCYSRMKDDLTNWIAGSIVTEDEFPLVIKSMSYGDLKECLPFLARRATENKAVLEGRGGASAERIRLGREIRRRFLPWTSY